MRRLCLMAVLVLQGACAGTPAVKKNNPDDVRAAEATDYLSKTHRHGEVIIGPQPAREDFAELAQLGVRAVVSFRTDAEHEALPFFEDYMAQSNDMVFRQIAIGDGQPYSEEKLQQLADFMAANPNGPVLLHCRSGVRAGHLWAAYLVKHRGLSPDQALAEIQPVDWWPLPMEKLLGRSLSLQFKDD